MHLSTLDNIFTQELLLKKMPGAVHWDQNKFKRICRPVFCFNPSITIVLLKELRRVLLVESLSML